MGHGQSSDPHSFPAAGQARQMHSPGERPHHVSPTINGACLTAHERSCRFRDMKKRAPAKKQSAARKPPAKKKPVSKPGAKSAAKTPAPRPAPSSTRAESSSQSPRYTPAALKTDGAPAFRYPPQ